MNPFSQSLGASLYQGLPCVASVSVGFSACSRHFSLFGGAKIGASTRLMEGAGRWRGPYGKPYGSACYAG